MNLKNVEVMENTQKTPKTRFLPALVGVASYALISVSAFAAEGDIDATPVVDGLKGLLTPIAAVGAAYLLVMVGLKGWKMIRRAM